MKREAGHAHTLSAVDRCGTAVNAQVVAGVKCRRDGWRFRSGSCAWRIPGVSCPVGFPAVGVLAPTPWNGMQGIRHRKCTEAMAGTSRGLDTVVGAAETFGQYGDMRVRINAVRPSGGRR